MSMRIPISTKMQVSKCGNTLPSAANNARALQTEKNFDSKYLYSGTPPNLAMLDSVE